MGLLSQKSLSRREQIRKDRPDTPARRWERMRTSGVVVSLQIALVFWVLATAILMLRQDVVPYRPGQWVHHDIISRVTFTYMDKQKLADAQGRARQNEPHVYSQVPDAWKSLEEKLLALPDRAAGARTLKELGADLPNILDLGSFTSLKDVQSTEEKRKQYEQKVRRYLAVLQQYDTTNPIIVLS